MIQDSNLEQLNTWTTNTNPQQVGGKQAPTACGYFYFGALGMVFYTKGLPYSNWLASIARPLLPNTGNAALDFDLVADTNICLQARERDVRISIGGYNYNFSWQIDEANGGMVDISNASSAWVPTGFKLGQLVPGATYHFRLVYTWNTSTQQYSFVSFTVNGQLYNIPSSLQNLKANKLGWADGVYVQVQQDLNASGGSAAEQLDNITLSYW